MRHWLAPFSLDGDELRCWRDEDEVQNKDGCVTYPVQTTLDLHTFASQLRDWQIGEMEKRIRVSMPLRPPAVPAAAAAHSTFEHVESVRHVTGGGVQDRVRAEPTELYAYRFSRAAPLGEVYDPARSGSRKSKKDLTRTGTGTGTGTVRKYPPTSTASANRNNHTHSHLNNAGQGEGGVGQRPGPGISITRVFKNGKDAYRHSTYAKSFKVVYGLALGISVVGIVVAVCFFRLGQKGQKFGEG